MILIDSNVFMYAAGKEHPSKSPSLAFLESAVVFHHGLEAIFSFDADFDRVEGLTRRSPAMYGQPAQL